MRASEPQAPGAIGAAVASLATGKRMVGEALRGPVPPFSLCPRCGSQSEVAWTNPVLDTMKRLGFYGGDVTGGEVLCQLCEPIVEEEFKNRQAATKSLGDCPLEYQRARLDTCINRPGAMTAVEAAYRFLEPDAAHDLYLCGPVGVGKTFIACAIGNELAQTVPGIRFVRVHTLLLKLQEAMNAENEHEGLSDYAVPPVLILDDIGVEKGSDYSRRTLQTLYDMRRDLGRRTIWTSNLDLDALNTFLNDDRLASRIAGAADVVWVDGDDLRLQQHAVGGRDLAAGGNEWDR